MFDRVRAYAREHPVPTALICLALVLFGVSIVTGNRWFEAAGQYGLVAATIIATVAGIRRTADVGAGLPPSEALDARLTITDDEAIALKAAADAQARGYLVLMGALFVGASLFAASIYDNFKLWRWIL